MIFSPQSKVWIYQSDRVFINQELDFLNEKLSAFTKNWTAHNQQLTAAYELKYGYFIILIVDETTAGASGCSIDKSVHLIKDIEQELGINLFDRFKIAWKSDGNIRISNRDEFEQLIEEGLINNKTQVFNNLVKNYSEYLTAWETPLAKSWHARIFNLPTA